MRELPRKQPARGERRPDAPDFTGTYVDLYGPTTGDRVRLADTNLIAEIEQDFTVYGDEFLRRRQDRARRHGDDARATNASGALDLVITNAIVIDPVLGIIKADIGIRDGRIAGIGKAGNPLLMDGVHPEMITAAGTEMIAGEGQIATAGGIDSHIHMISPQQAYAAISNGVTTHIGGGTGPADGTNATTCTPGPWNIQRMLLACEACRSMSACWARGTAASPTCCARWSKRGLAA